MTGVFLAWFGLAANLTVMGSVDPGGFCPFKSLMASSASALLSKRMKATPRESPAEPQKIILMHVHVHSKPQATLNLPTCGLIDKNAGVDNAAVSCKHVFDILLGHCFRQSADVEVGILYRVGARPGIRHLTEEKKL